GRGIGLGVGRDPLDLAADYAALGVELVDGQADAAQVVLAAVAVLAAGVAGQAELDRLGALRPHAVVRPGSEQRARATQRSRHQAALHDGAAGHGMLGIAWLLHRLPPPKLL